ncbi:aflatoxin regulatory protein-domain-containing protein [Aspergillus aurantiobrunneus]
MESTTVPQPHAPARPTAPGGTQSARKLRESCISCSRSKVKCDKEKPTCGRCVRRGLPCEYMVSRRTGRTRVIGVERPSTTTATATTAATTTTTESSTATSAANPPVTHPSLPQHTDIASTAACSEQALPAVTPHAPPIVTRPSPRSTQLHSPSSETELWNAFLSPNASSSTDLTSLLSLNTDIGQLFASLSPSQLDEPENMETDQHTHGLGELSVADPSSSLMLGLKGSDAIPPPGSDTNAHACCLAICLDILMRLFPNARLACERPGNEDAPGKLCTIESVIEDNKQILETVHTVLECRCAEDEYVATLVSLIVFKVLGWYVAAARDRSSDPARDEEFNWGVGDSSGQHSRRPSVSSFEEQVLHLPTVVGSYCVDGHHQSRMAAQLVLSELYRVQRLVTLVGRRLEAIRQRSLTVDSTSSSSSASSSVPDSGGGLPMLPGIPAAPLSFTTLVHLEEDLRKRLRAVSSETISILRRA